MSFEVSKAVTTQKMFFFLMQKIDQANLGAVMHCDKS